MHASVRGKIAGLHSGRWPAADVPVQLYLLLQCPLLQSDVGEGAGSAPHFRKKKVGRPKSMMTPVAVGPP